MNEGLLHVFVDQRARVTLGVHHKGSDEGVVPVIEEDLRAAHAAGGLAVGLRVYQGEPEGVFPQGEEVLEEGIIPVGVHAAGGVGVAGGGPGGVVVGHDGGAQGVGQPQRRLVVVVGGLVVDHNVPLAADVIGGVLARAQVIIEAGGRVGHAVVLQVLGVEHALEHRAARHLLVGGGEAGGVCPGAQIGQGGLARVLGKLRVAGVVVVLVQAQPEIRGVRLVVRLAGFAHAHLQVREAVHIIGKADHHHGGGGLVDYVGGGGGVGREGEKARAVGGRRAEGPLLDKGGGVVHLVGLGGVQPDPDLLPRGVIQHRVQVGEDLRLVPAVLVDAPGVVGIAAGVVGVAARGGAGPGGGPAVVNGLARAPGHGGEGVEIHRYSRRGGLERVVAHIIFGLQGRPVLGLVAVRQHLGQLGGVDRVVHKGAVCFQGDRAGRAHAQGQLVEAGGLALVHHHVALDGDLGLGGRAVEQGAGALRRSCQGRAAEKRARKRRRQEQRSQTAEPAGPSLSCLHGDTPVSKGLLFSLFLRGVPHFAQNF